MGDSERRVREVESRNRKGNGGRVEDASVGGYNGEVGGREREGFGRNGKREEWGRMRKGRRL